MSKTYRSMYLVCGSCKAAVDNTDKYCNYCGKAIWLKDVSDIPVVSSTETPKPITEIVEKPEDERLQIEKLQQQLENLSRAKLQQELQKWLPTIFPNYYYVAPNPMPKTTLDFLVQHMGKERTYGMSILGYGFDPANNRFFVFDEHTMLYKTLANNEMLCEISYLSIREIEACGGQLLIGTDTMGTKTLSMSQEPAMAELLAAITGASLKLCNNNSATKAIAGGNSTVSDGEQPVVSNSSESSNSSGTTIQSGNNQSAGAPAQKTGYTVKDYVREHTNAFMSLIMLVVRLCLGMLCYGLLSSGDAAVWGVLFGLFTLVIGYTRPWVMVACWLFCTAVVDDPNIGAESSQGGWWGAAVTFLTVALVCRFILWIKYKNYMAQGKKQ